MKLAIVDLDQVVADSTERFNRAEAAKRAWLNDLKNVLRSEGQATSIYWQTAFTPELVALDTLIDGAREALEQVMEEGYQLLYLTSRPESMRQATLTWLMDRGILQYANGGNIDWIEVVMKASAFQYVKTSTWKAGIVATLVALWGVEEVVFIDDEEANTTTLLEQYPEGQDFSLHCFQSLAEVVEWLNIPVPTLPEEEDEDPFLPEEK